jgi:hypothetical protein
VRVLAQPGSRPVHLRPAEGVVFKVAVVQAATASAVVRCMRWRTFKQRVQVVEIPHPRVEQRSSAANLVQQRANPASVHPEQAERTGRAAT